MNLETIQQLLLQSRQALQLIAAIAVFNALALLMQVFLLYA